VGKVAEPMNQAPGFGATTGGILLVDDSRAYRSVLRDLVEDLGYAVVGEASSGEEALRVCDRQEPDLVLMDVDMPGMGGIESTRHIKRGHPDVQVIGLSLHGDEATGRAMREAGAMTHLDKAAGPSAIERALAACLRGH